MISLDGLITYLSGGPCIAWVGAGPSIEMGFPGWGSLAQSLFEIAKTQRKNNFNKVEAYYRGGKYPEFFGEIQRGYGSEFLIKNCRTLLKPSRAEGDLYKAIWKLPFIGYFTTNYDDLLFNHLPANKAFKIYQNDKESLGSVEVNSIPSIVKLHGSLTEGLENTLVITDDQYRLWYDQGEKEYFRQFIQGHLTTQRIVFIGYSLNDPEILQLQRRLSANLRRKTPAIAILANASDTDLDYWEREFNIAVISYKTDGDDHSQLKYILNTASRFVGNTTKTVPIKVEEAKLAQKFYLWHKFSQTSDQRTKIDALKSVVLMTANELGRPTFDNVMIADKLKDIILFDSSILVADIEKCLNELVVGGWVVLEKGKYKIETTAKTVITNLNRQYEDLIQTFIQQVRLDLHARDNSISPQLLGQASTIVFDILSEIFAVRGTEVVQLAFAKTPVQISGATDILSIIWSKSSNLGDINLTYLLTNYVVDLITKPQGVSENVIDYLSKAFVSMQALRIHQGEEELLNEFYKNQAFLIDENVLIPLIAQGEPRHDLCINTIKAATAKGVFLFTTDFFEHEVFRHGAWARDMVAQYGEQSTQVLKAARGEGGFAANAFLDGYISESPKNPTGYDFNDYLTHCGEGTFSDNGIWKKLEFLGIKRLNQKQTRESVGDTATVHQSVQQYIETEVAWRGGEKSPQRIEREADAYTIIYHWDTLKNIFGQEHRPQCSFMTFATALALAANKGPFPISRSILASPQAVYELLVRYLGQKTEEISIGMVLRSSYFRTVGQFIDKAKYADFFAPLITEFHKTYREHYELYRRYVESKLTKGVINEYDPLDRVDFVNSLERKLQSLPSHIVEDNKKLLEENALLKQMIQQKDEKERKRKAFIKQQRFLSTKRNTNKEKKESP